MGNKFFGWILVFVLLVSSVFAGISYSNVLSVYQEDYGLDNVTVLNDYQFVYYYPKSIDFDNWTLQEQFDEELNETVNVSVNVPYTINYYRASIIEVVGWSIHDKIISEVVLSVE